MKTEPAKAITFRELKTFCNTLNDEQLECPVIASGEERGFNIQDVGELEEDYFVDDYAMQPVSVYDGEEDPEYPTPQSQGYQIIPKGTPYMYFDLWKDIPESE
jgi:hypothetical protein